MVKTFVASRRGDLSPWSVKNRPGKKSEIGEIPRAIRKGGQSAEKRAFLSFCICLVSATNRKVTSASNTGTKASLGYRETADRIAWPLRTVHSPSHIKTLKKREVETRSHAKNAQARKGALLRRGEEDVQLCWQANQIYPHFNASSGSNNGVSPHCTVIPIKKSRSSEPVLS